MAKSIVVCCDGTWNWIGQRHLTNVAKFKHALGERDEWGEQQVVEHFNGVGTAPLTRLLGGAFGVGLSDKVQEAYLFIARKYQPGDRIYLIGFSRGAYTARSVAGMIRNVGIVKNPNDEAVLREAFHLYRDRDDATHPDSAAAATFIKKNSHEANAHFIGVWDTVGALGIPVKGPKWLEDFNKRFAFHDTDLSGKVSYAFQALAIDERRGPFVPAIWQVDPDAKGQTVEQVWFSGAHSDVGGGLARTGLSDLALLWMAERATDGGLRFKPGALDGPNPSIVTRDGFRIPVVPNLWSSIDQSRRNVFRLMKAFERVLGTRSTDRESAAWSAIERLKPPTKYSPNNLLAFRKNWPDRVTQRRQMADAVAP